MKSIYYYLEKQIAAQFFAAKDAIFEAARKMTREEREAAREEIIHEATLYDIPRQLDDPRELYTVDADGTALIPVSGKLTNRVDVCDGFYSDVTTYGFIQLAARTADEDPNVQAIRFLFSTGGGQVFGADETAQVLRALKKPTEARVSGMAASCGYYLASQLDRIVLAAPTAFVGSIGVVMELIDRSKQDEARGITRYVLTSTDAPDKRPDFTKREGQEVYLKELDSLHAIFVKRVAAGRNVDEKFVSENFGRGGLVAADEALRLGMIDEILGDVNESPIIISKKQEDKEMSDPKTLGLDEFLAQNPAAKADFDARITKTAVDAVKGEREAQAAKIARIEPYLGSKDYPPKIKELGGKVLKGEVDVSAFDAAVAAVDAVKEAQASREAGKETKEQKETAGSGKKPGGSEEGIIASEEDILAEVGRKEGDA